jgi:hypothetical protein
LVEIACNEARVPCACYEHPHVSLITGRNSEYPGFDFFIERHSDRELVRMGPQMVKRRLKDEWGCVTGKDARTRVGDGKERVCGIVWPTLKELRAKFEAEHGPQKWLHDDVEQWIGG